MPRVDRAIFVVGLAFGDCGKGAIIDSLARRYADENPLVVRFNGGPQAGHNVVAPDGRHHTFSQFGSGTFVPGVRTLLSRFVFIEPYALLNEAAHLRQLGITDAFERLMMDRRCAVITPAHQAANRLRELRRGAADAHGTCGLGIGETARDLIHRPDLLLRASDLTNRVLVAARLREWCAMKLANVGGNAAIAPGDPRVASALETLRNPTWIETAVEVYATVGRKIELVHQTPAILRSGLKIFEGAQGVLLDETYGFHPHTTWSTTTFANAERLMDESGSAQPRVRLGVVRTYFTRHGAGPLMTENLDLNLVESHNGDDCWQGQFRRGYFDLVGFRYAVEAAGGIDALAVTHLDALPKLGHVCIGYRPPGDFEPDWFRSDGIVTGIRVRADASLEARRSLTRALLKCQPIYQKVDSHPAAFVDLIRREAGSPQIAITCRGNRAGDHVYHGDVFDQANSAGSAICCAPDAGE